MVPATSINVVSPTVRRRRHRRRTADYRWTYDEYQRLVDVGFSFGTRVELIGGRIVRMAAQRDLHVIAVALVKATLATAFGAGYWVRDQAPLHLDHWSGPEPDVAVVPGKPRDYIGKGHPTSALLVVEVSDTTLRRDRRRKGPRYARAGYADFWIVNLVDRCLEVYRNPVPDPSARLGWRYADVAILSPSDTISPSAMPTAIVAVADLLP